jgi:hypothetical protein
MGAEVAQRVNSRPYRDHLAKDPDAARAIDQPPPQRARSRLCVLMTIIAYVDLLE